MHASSSLVCFRVEGTRKEKKSCPSHLSPLKKKRKTHQALRRGDASEAVKFLRREVTPVAPDAATLRALAARLLSAASKKEEGEESEEGTAAAAAAGSNGGANSNGFGRSSSHGRRSRRHTRGGDDDEEEEAFFDARDASRHHHHHRPSLPSPLLPPPPASSPASAAFVFSPEAVDCWPGPAAGSRERALEALQSLLLSCSSSSSSASASASSSSSSAAVVAGGSLLPRHRLLTLLEQALAAQRSAARAHNAPPRPPITLLADYGAAVAAAAGRRWYGNGGGDGGGNGSGAAGAAANGNGVGNGGASPSATTAALAGAGASASPFFFSGPLSPASASALPHVGMDGLPCVTTQVLLDHGDEVWHLAFSPCGTRLATGGADGVAILWHVERDERGRRRVRKGRELRGHAGPVALLAWSPLDAGATLATAGPDGTVRLWDGRSGESVAVLSHHGSLVTAMGWVPVLTNSFAADPPGVSSRMYRRCGRLVTAGHDRCVHLVDAGEAIVAAGSAARARRLRELQRERQQQRGGGGGGGARRERRRRHDQTSSSSSGGDSSSSSEEEDEEEEQEPLPALPPPSTSSRILRTWRGTRVNDLAVTPDGRTLLTVSSDRRVRFWDLSRGAELFRVAPAASAAGGAGRGGRASRLGGGAAGASASAPPSASQQSQQQQQPQPPLAVPVVAEAESIISLSLSRAGDALLLNLSNQQLHAWRVPGRHELAPLSVGAGSSSSAEQQRGGGGRGGGSSEDREGGDPPVTITTAAPSSSQAAATGGAAPSSSSQQPAANPAASASAQPPPPPPQPIMTYRGPPARQGRFVVRSCFGGLDDAFALSGAEDCRVYCWDRRSGELLAALDGHSGTVNAVAWNPADPGMFASASDDKSVHIWGLESDLGDDDEDEEGEEEEGESDDDNDDDEGVSL